MLKSNKIFLGALTTAMVIVPVASSSASTLHLPTPVAQLADSILSHLHPKASASATPSTGATSSNTASSTLPVGAPPSKHYTVQQQPPADSCHYRWIGAEPLPDPKCTPGALNPEVTQANLASTICKKGYTATIRPSAYITGQEKKLNALSYGYTGSFKTGEYDHLVSLELGGNANDERNLWVEPQALGSHNRTTLNDKDKVENLLNAAVCSGKVTLSAAQFAIATNWTVALANLGLK